MTIFSVRSLTAAALSIFAFFTVAHAASTDMSHEMSMPMAQHMTTEIYHGHGVVKKVTNDSISIAHLPVSALNWPAMTMTFSLPDAGGLPVVKAGDTVDFTFSQQADGYTLASVTPIK
jgi:Cu(I)/Ag(I) efflux system protein CusF